MRGVRPPVRGGAFIQGWETQKILSRFAAHERSDQFFGSLFHLWFFGSLFSNIGVSRPEIACMAKVTHPSVSLVQMSI